MRRPSTRGSRRRPGTGTVASVIEEQAATLGEKLELRQLVRLTGDKFEIYLHRTSKDLPPQIGVVLAYTGDDAETARSIAQHISFANPEYVSKDEVPGRPRSTTSAASSRRSRAVRASPRLPCRRSSRVVIGAFYKQVALLEQDYAKDNKLTVAKVAIDAGLTITGFARFKVGA